MRKLTLLFLLLIFSLCIYADQVIISGNIRFNLRDDNTYIIVPEGEIATTESGRKVLLKNNGTWENYTERTRNIIITDRNGRKIWVRGDGRWGYMNKTGYLNDDFRFKEISLNSEGRNTRITGKVRNISGNDYSTTVFNIIVFDGDRYEYRNLGEIEIRDFRDGDEVRFEGVLNISRSDIQDYYIELREARKEEIKKIKVEKGNKNKTIGEAYIELNFGK